MSDELEVAFQAGFEKEAQASNISSVSRALNPAGAAGYEEAKGVPASTGMASQVLPGAAMGGAVGVPYGAALGGTAGGGRGAALGALAGSAGGALYGGAVQPLAYGLSRLLTFESGDKAPEQNGPNA